MRVNLVVPCYNEAKRLDPAAFVEAALADESLHFLFVDDGSTDDTRAVLDELVVRVPERLEAVSLPANAGKGEAVRQGMLRVLARPGYSGYWDADLATPLDELPSFSTLLDADDAVQVVLGSRVRLLGRQIERELARHLSGRVFATAVSATLGLPVYDTQCGAKLFRATDAVRDAFASPFVSRWIFDVEILARLVRGWSDDLPPAARIVELPLRRWREIGGSKLRTKDMARAAIELARIGAEFRR